ncbi:MAG TPA: aminopeptidase P family protein [Paludibacter sp.]|nr:aminopeptidase P family protein [Paludibacter sp.]
MESIINRISFLREAMRNAGVAACIIPGTDPHASEYIAEHWKERVWISGFNGSAGTAVVALDKAGLWTDSRYFLQAADQLAGTGIELMKQGLPETLDIIPWLVSELKSGEKVGVNAQMFSVNGYAAMKAELQLSGIELVSIDLPGQVWTDRPSLPLNPFFVFDIKYTGKSAADKLADLRAEMKKARANVFVMSALDDIAWLFNIRGNDVDYNPVTIAYALVEEDKATLFIAPEKVTGATKQYLTKEGVSVAGYLEIYTALKDIVTSTAVLVDGAKLNQSLFEAIPSGCAIRNSMSPVFKLKSIKNEVEMAGYRRAMVKDGVALTRFFKWLEENVASGELTEVSIDEKLYEFRSQQENFIGESFGTIAGYGSHGAIVHYSATEESAATLKPEGIFLLDSGGQYLDGTTDITRTVALGKVTEQQKTDFTLVLKGHIALSMAIFPAGTRGSQLDILARKAMWSLGLNYGHGTGHGVGHFLNVHEGPQSIRAEENPVVLQPGMFLSNEPGLYRVGEYGIRTENLVHIIPAMKTDFGQFLQFETVTLFPIDRELIDIIVLDHDEANWVDEYHQKVYDALSPFLNADEKAWLETKCSPIYDLIF